MRTCISVARQMRRSSTTGRFRVLTHSLGYATDNNEYLEEGQPHLLFWKRLTVRRA